MKLSRDQVCLISQMVEESAVSLPTLKDDLIDHLCCVIEVKLEAGISFEVALAQALKEVAPHGLDAIQSQTVYLLNPPKVMFMKKIMFVIGFLSAIAVSLGWLFVTLRWPGGKELFNAGFFGLLMVFIPMMGIHRYKVVMGKGLSDKVRILSGSVSSFIVGLSLVFKVMHLQGADVVLIVGVSLFTFGFLPFLFFNLYRKSASGAAF